MDDLKDNSKNINQTQSSFATILKEETSTQFGTQLKNDHTLEEKLQNDSYFVDNYQEIKEQDISTDKEEKADVRRSMSHSLSDMFVNTPKKSSFLTSVLNIINTTVGLGIVSFPYVIKVFGIILGSFLTLIGYGLTLFSCKVLLKARIYSKKPNQVDYHKLAVQCFGRAGEIINQLIICITMLGVCIVLQQIFCVSIKKIKNEYFQSYSTFWLSSTFFILLSGLSRIPFIFARTTEKLKFASYIATSAILTFIFVVIYNFAIQIQKGLPHFSWLPDENCTVSNVFLCLSVVALAFGFQMNFYPIYKCLHNADDSRMMKVCVTSQSAVTLIYIGVGVIGYISAGSAIGTLGTDSDYLDNFNAQNLGKAIYLILYIAYCLVAIFHFPLFFFQGRNTLFFLIKQLLIKLKLIKDKKKELLDIVKQSNIPISKVIEKEKNQLLSFKDKDILYFINSLILYIVIVVLGVFWSNLLDAFGLIGSIGANSISFILPSLFYFFLAKTRKKTQTYQANIGFMIFGFISGITCTSVAIYNLK